jgi:hypothetical protein
MPKWIPKLPRWATPKGWLAGLGPKPRRNGQAWVRPNGHTGGGGFASQGTNGNGRNLLAEIEAMEEKIGKCMYRGLLRRVARVWAPRQIRENFCSTTTAGANAGSRTRPGSTAGCASETRA